ncbi:MAG: hypothetical protein NC218_06765 [Acetobacter sp.]|nr:hypothetical protein [Acetobacter sp.]
MSTLLTDRLSVVGQGMLKRIFASSLIFALKGAKNLPVYRLKSFISDLEKFSTKPEISFRFRELGLKPENIAIWQDCLASGVYDTKTLAIQLQKEMQPLLKQKDTQLADFWQIYVCIYAKQLLLLGSQTICAPNSLFNQETVHYFINHPEHTHGEELINGIPPLLEKGYIYLNNCGENQQTDWHRNTFMDSYFKALMSYQDVLSKEDISQLFTQRKQ